MTMSDDEISVRGRPRSGNNSRATFSGREARGPIIDQDGHEIRPETLEQGFGFEFGQDSSFANPFGNLTREQLCQRLEPRQPLL
ncbi:DUF4112 domain-containing protein, partial [Bradyrhizobium guangdongense]